MSYNYPFTSGEAKEDGGEHHKKGQHDNPYHDVTRERKGEDIKREDEDPQTTNTRNNNGEAKCKDYDGGDDPNVVNGYI